MIATATAGLLLLPGCGARKAPAPWHAVTIPTDADFTGLWFADSLNGWVTGGGWSIEGGIVGRTRDGGRTWRFESGILPGAEKGQGLGRVQFRDTLHGCVTAAYGPVLVTGDGGATWRPGRLSGLGSGRLSDMHFIDSWNGWAAGSEVVRTEDGGETWRTLATTPPEKGYLTGLHFVDEGRGWLISHSGGLMRSDNGGIDWFPVALPVRPGEHPTFRDVTFVGFRHGWVVGDRGSIFHTGDAGATWALQENGVPVVRVIPKGEPPRPREPIPELEVEPDRLTLMAIRFADPEHGWAVGYYADVAESVVLRTDDGGATWATEHVQPGELLRSLFVLDRDHAWAAGDRARRRPQVVLRYSLRAR